MKRVGTIACASLTLLLSCAKPVSKANEPVHARSSPSSSSSSAPCPAEAVSYEARSASRVAVRLPEVPTLPPRPVRKGEAFTVWGASYFLRSRVHHPEVSGKRITVEGYVVKTNLADAPRCAVHPGGVADPPDCHSPIPAFWIGDTPNASPGTAIRVMGWASNFAQVFDAMRSFDSGSEDTEYSDVFWGVKVPNPLPAVGAKVQVVGVYDRTFAMSATGAVTDPVMGVLRYETLQYLEPAGELAVLPGVRRVRAARRAGSR